jgi:UDP-3-O-[3-hydroxymyristoyl] glucosamine N-acyltransferase
MKGFLRSLVRATTVRDIVAGLAGPARIVGEADRRVAGVGALLPGYPDTLAFCDAEDARDRLAASQASVILARGFCQPGPAQTFIMVDDPRVSFIHAVERLLPGSGRPREPAVGIHPGARVDADAEVSPGAAIGDEVAIGAGTRIGSGAVIYAGCTIGAHCSIGPGTVVGWVGLAYHTARDGRREFFPHLGGVRIGDWVDIGANSCICRGMLSDTTIGDDAKIGSLVYLSHGTTIGDHAWVSASVALAGHSTVGEDGLLGIGAVVIDNVALAPGVIVGGGAVVTHSASAGQKLVGVPAHHAPSLRRFGPTPRDD